MEYSVSKNSDSLPFFQKVRSAFASFSLLSKLGLFIVLMCCITSGIVFAFLFNDSFKVNVPETGGMLKEGVIGFPSAINPVLAQSQTDKDIAALIFSGMLQQNEDGTFSPNMAESYTISADGKTYDFILKKGLTFHDGTPLTADDVLYSTTLAQTSLPILWQNVQVTKINDYEIAFTLAKAAHSFLGNFTLGILPHTSSGSSTPIGSGPYKITMIKNAIDGTPEYYELGAFKKFVSGRPYIDHIIVRFYANENALVQGFRDNEIDGASGISMDVAKILQSSSTHIENIPTDRVFGVFFNQKNQDSTGIDDPAVRQALNIAIDRDDLVSTVFNSIGSALYLPVPTSLLQPSITTAATVKNWQAINGERLTDARTVLYQAGWKENDQGVMEKDVKGKEPQTLSFVLNVPDVPALAATAEYLKSTWARIGVAVTLKTSDSATFSRDILAEKKYQAVLFGQELGNPINLSPFWHTTTMSTSTISANASMWSNKGTDTLLEDAESTTSDESRLVDLQQTEDMLIQNLPAIFLYQPAYAYVVPKATLTGKFVIAESPEDRFDSVKTWHIETERVWKMFAQ